MLFTATRRQLLLLAIAALAFPMANATTINQLIIGTGSVTGVYYPAGGAICRLINKNQPQRTIRCSVQATEGSIANLQALQAQNINLAVVQSDAQLAALKGIEEFASTGPNSA